MKVIGMLGYIDKVDLVTSLTKMVQSLGKAVLVVDATNDKKYKYVIPAIDTIDKEYITQFDGVDYAVGFDSMIDVENHLVKQKINVSLYDYIFIDIDSERTYEFFRAKNFDSLFLIMDTSMLGYKKNLEILNTMKIYDSQSDTKISKVLYRAYLTRTGVRYFEEKLNSIDANWDEREYEVEESEQEKMMYLDFQISGIIQLKKHSKVFVNTVTDILMKIVTDINVADIKRAIKKGGN